MKTHSNFFTVCLVGLLFGVTQLSAQAAPKSDSSVLPFAEPGQASTSHVDKEGNEVFD